MNAGDRWPYWTPTNELRWNGAVLEQRWEPTKGPGSEWRAVPQAAAEAAEPRTD